jgi:NADPH:quinone reductase-like Zn-dependent oxidoreductase
MNPMSIGLNSPRLGKSWSLGADVAINYSNKGWPNQVREATGGKGVHVVSDPEYL